MPRGSRSRSGCARCKGQHMKCDEQRPSCGRCLRAKKPCPGYQKVIKWSRKHEFHSEDETTQQETQLLSPSRSSILPTDPGTLLSIAEDSLEDATNDLMSHNSRIGGPNFDVSDWLGDLATFAFPSAGPQQILTVGGQSHSPSMPWLPPETSNEFEEGIQPEPSDGEINLLPLEESPKSSQVMELSQDDEETLVSPLASSIMASLTDSTTLLSDFYFQETARSFSVYDGGMNPFRSLVGRLWSQSRVIYCAMQSMAATGLENLYPSLGPIGKEYRRETVALLMGNDDCDETSLLALLMIGASSSWHDPTASGVSLFNSFQNRMQRATARAYFLENSNNYRFFHESLIYWQMLLSYVVDDFRMGSYQILGPVQLPSGTMQAPHPWTGVGHEVQKVLCDIGHLVRSQRQHARLPVTITQGHIDRLQNSIIKAFELEGRLLQLTLPSEDQIINPADVNTPVQHLVNLAQIYRLVGLLQLYRIFPDILWQRLQSPTSELSADIRPFFEKLGHHTTPWDNERGYLPHNPARQDLGSWLTIFALNILEIFRHIPVESGTRAFQPFLLVACGSELRVPQSKTPEGSIAAGLKPQCGENLDFVPAVSLKAVEVLRARGMVLGRLEQLAHLLAPKPHRQCISVVKEIWKKMDALSAVIPGAECSEDAQDSVFWIDIMIENGWETIMG
ncbi:hypothetical protein BGZ61DRAFT_393190 [Ilyonectria robusta]|uniref:uncharacterized protein n=1 Tax=Ilyonectria robusta TaxID=1079257 RepID=UPI001E8E9C9F|nr:uncharacterized protein BGZ61DRAFT_393190 [Ilyonectria robusta]KAH8686475.1 hypothetical protein BGZ61DRAFT_393190 [Ilyonectria robusta]